MQHLARAAERRGVDAIALLHNHHTVFPRLGLEDALDLTGNVRHRDGPRGDVILEACGEEHSERERHLREFERED